MSDDILSSLNKNNGTTTTKNVNTAVEAPLAPRRSARIAQRAAMARLNSTATSDQSRKRKRVPRQRKAIQEPAIQEPASQYTPLAASQYYSEDDYDYSPPRYPLMHFAPEPLPPMQFTREKQNSNRFNCTFDEYNPYISVKIIWGQELEVFEMRLHQKFVRIFEAFAARENSQVEKVGLYLGKSIINPEDTPHSIYYSYDLIDGRIFPENAKRRPKREENNPNEITLKIQSGGRKHSFFLKMQKTDRFIFLFIKCAEELDVPPESIKLSFDYEYLDYSDTPNDLDMDDNDVIDLTY